MTISKNGASKLRARTSVSSLCLVAASLSWLSPSTVLAQSASTGVGEAASETTIVVTGSRITRPQTASPTPIVELDSSSIEQFGATNIADALNGLPAFSAASASPRTTNTSTTGVGLNLIDLRNLGPSRTLVLVNGRRHVSASAGTSAVDLNSIPTDFIERVDIVTGGASAIYGSEAVAGVVNIILKKNVEGLTLRAQGGVTDHGDGKNFGVAATYGASFAEGRGNIALHAAFYKDGLVQSKDRRWSRSDAFQRADGSVQIPARSGATADSSFTLPLATGGTRTVTRGADGLFNATLTQDNRFDRAPYRQLIVPTKRGLFAANLNYEFNNALELTAEGTYAETHATAVSEPIVLGSIWPLGRGGQSQGLWNLPVSSPFIPNEIRSVLDPAATSIAFLARPLRLGNRTHPNQRSMIRGVVGLNGRLADNWKWDAYVEYGRSKEDARIQNLANSYRFIEALNVETVGSSVRCVNPVARAAGCVPYNPFGRDAVSDAAVDYIRAEARYKTDIRQFVAAATISGSLFSWGAGDALVAAGIEYRKEKSSFLVDDLTQAGALTIGQQANTVGRFDVIEGFGEGSLPLLTDAGFVESLVVDAAGRYAHYSSIGNSLSWKVGANMDTSAGLSFRATYSKASRAPNISELFLPQQGSSGRLSDPCAAGGVTSGLSAAAAAIRTANCTALGLGSSFLPDQIALESVTGRTGGNPNLQEEVAYTLTAGAVFKPDFIPGFSFSADYWRIRIKDAIGSISRQLTVNQCVDQPNITNEFCGNVVRDPVTGNIRGVNTLIQNLATEKVAGIDFSAIYRAGVVDKLNATVTLLATRLTEDQVQQYAGAEVVDQLKQIGHTKWRGLGSVLIEYGPTSFFWKTRYIGSALKDVAVNSAFNRVKPIWYSDAQLRHRAGNGLEAYIGVDNVFNKAPPLIASPNPAADISSQTASGVYDSIGRRFYLGFSWSFR